jgi:hypothetical protein
MAKRRQPGIMDFVNPHKVGFRWGGGVVSNTTFTAIVALLAISFVCWVFSGRPEMALIASAGIIFFAALAIVGNWIFASKHPDLAALGGPEYASVRQRQMGTKDHPKIVDAQSVEAPTLIEQGASRDGV